MVPRSMILSELWPGLQGHNIFWSRMSENSVSYGYCYYNKLMGNHTKHTEWYHVWWPWLTPSKRVIRFVSGSWASCISSSACAAVNDCCILQMISGYFRARGLVVQREQVRQRLKRVDPLGASARRSRAVTRRTYSVPTPNALWHIDSHMKLVRCRFTTCSDISDNIPS